MVTPPIPRVERRKVNKRVYYWGVVCVALLVASILVNAWLVYRQTNYRKDAAQEAACISIANQDIMFTAHTGQKPPVNIRLLCDGHSEIQIIQATIKNGGIK